jgi:hypothetical protein
VQVREFLAATLAELVAGRAARIAATQCQQVLAGVGFATEHELPCAISQCPVSIKTIPRLVER